MKPIKLNKIPKDPCENCIVRAGCSNICMDKVSYAQYIASFYHGSITSHPRGKRRKNADALTELYIKNRNFCHYYSYKGKRRSALMID